MAAPGVSAASSTVPAIAASAGGTSGLDPWLVTLRTAIAAEPVPDSLACSLAPLAAIGVDIAGDVATAVTRLLNTPPERWHAHDWRRTRPDFPTKYALALHAYTLHTPNLFAPLGDARTPLCLRVRFLLLAITELFLGVGLETWLEFVLKVKMAG